MSDRKDMSQAAYTPLNIDVEEDNSTPLVPQLSRSRLIILLAASLVTNALLLSATAFFWNRQHQCPWRGVQPLYSPVQDAISYEYSLSAGLAGRTKWHGPPSPLVDSAWENLYELGIASIPKDQARLLPNRTLPIPGDEENYITGLDVFHQLHCLDMLRKSQWPDHYGPTKFRYQNLSLHGGEPLWDHVDHCINSLRESIMCNADVTPWVYQWNNAAQMAIPRLDVVHTCKKWDDIHAWAEKWRTRTHFDLRVHVQDDLKFPNDMYES